MTTVMREQMASDQASPLTLPLVLYPAALAGALARFAPLDRNNRIWLFLVGGSAPAFGSTVSVILWCSFVWAVLSLGLRRFAFSPDRWIGAVAIACGLYGLVKIAASLAHGGFSGSYSLLNTLVFFAPLFVGIRQRLTPPREVLDLFVLSTGASVIVAAPIAAWQALSIGLRAEAFCGNPGVFAVMSVMFGSIGALNVASRRVPRRWFGVASWLAMIFCVVASGMRAVWLVVPVVTLAIIWVASRNLPKPVLRRGVAAALAALGIGLVLASGPISDRIAQFGNDIALMQENRDFNSSTGRRIVMLDAGWRAFLESPWTGYGVTGRMDAVRAQLGADDEWLVPFSHPHNGYLAALLDAGIAGLVALLIVLLAPLAVALFSQRDEGWRLRVAIGWIMTMTYGISGAPGILFEHDLMNSAFVVTLIVLACTIAPHARAANGGAVE